MANFNIDVEKFKSFCEANGGQSTLSRSLGYGRSWASGIVLEGKITAAANKLLCMSYNLPLDYFKAPEKPEQTKMELGSEGYELHLKVNDKNKSVYVMLSYDGAKVESAYAKILGEGKRALAKSISYATHMIYKNLEQKELADK